MTPSGHGAEPDDWVARDDWRDWDAPEADVVPTPGAARLLTPMLPPGGGAATMPVPAALAAGPDGTVAVEVGGYRVGNLAGEAAAAVEQAIGEAPSGRLAVPALVVRDGEGGAPHVRLWAGRRLGAGIGVMAERQREDHASRVGPAPTPPGRQRARG